MKIFIDNFNLDNIKKVDTIKLLNEKETKTFLEKDSFYNIQESYLENIDKFSKTILKVLVARADRLTRNGTYYSSSLFQNIIENQRDFWQYSPCLSDHPNTSILGDEAIWGDPLRICGVWLDAEMDSQGLVWGYLQFTGQNGKDLLDYILKGGRVAFSIVGIGDSTIDSQGKEIIDESSYKMIRLADLVLRPSAPLVSFALDRTINKMTDILDVRNNTYVINHKKEANFQGGDDYQEKENNILNITKKDNKEELKKEKINKIEENETKTEDEKLDKSLDSLVDKLVEKVSKKLNLNSNK